MIISIIIRPFANHEPESRDSEASSDTIFILAFSIIMLNTDLLAASECSHLRSFNQQHATIWPCFCHILFFARGLHRKAQSWSEEKDVSWGVCAPASQMFELFSTVFLFFLFFRIEHEHYIIILRICDLFTWISSFSYSEIESSSRMHLMHLIEGNNRGIDGGKEQARWGCRVACR